MSAPSDPRAAFERWIETAEAKCLIEIPIPADMFALAMCRRIEHAFQAGFNAALRSTQRGEQ